MDQLFYACLILFPLGISLRMSLRLLYGARGPQVDDPIHQMMSVAGSVLTITPVIVFIFTITSGGGVLLLILVASAGLEMIVAQRAMQRQAVWALLSGEFTGRSPSSDAMSHHQQRFTGIVGRAFRRLLAALDQGTDLRTAIGSCPKALPDESQAYAAIDAIVSSAAKADNDDDDNDNAEDSCISNQWTFVEGQLASTTRQLSQRFVYLGFVLLVMFGIIAFLVYKIIPSYVLIFEDFDLELPRITVSLISVSTVIINSTISALVGIGLLLFILLVFVVVFCYLCDMPVLRPIADRIFFSRHRAFVLRLLAIAVERGQPFADICEQLTGNRPRYPSQLARIRLARAGQEISSGRDWKDALRQQSFLRSADFPMLETGQSVGNLPWVLRTLANQKLRKMVFRWTAIEQIAFPCAVVLLGLVVMWICVALFLPLVDLISSLA